MRQAGTELKTEENRQGLCVHLSSIRLRSSCTMYKIKAVYGKARDQLDKNPQCFHSNYRNLVIERMVLKGGVLEALFEDCINNTSSMSRLYNNYVNIFEQAVSRTWYTCDSCQHISYQLPSEITIYRFPRKQCFSTCYCSGRQLS